MRNKKNIFLAIILSIAFFLRFYQLGNVPFGFYQDESAIGYNSYSILATGKDEHGQSYPLYFKSFGDYKLPIYIYLTAVSVKLLGLNEFAVRFPSALFGFFTVIAFYFFVKEITKNEKIAIVASFLLAVNPWHLHYSRATFEVSISLFLFVLGGLFLFKALVKKKKGMFMLGTLCFIINLYTYNLTRLLSPLLFVLFIMLLRRDVKNISRSELVTTCLVSFFLLAPFLLTLLGSEGVTSAKGTLIFSSAAVQAPLLEFRSYLTQLPPFFVKLFFNQLSLTKWQYIENIFSYFSVPFFFISGSPHGNHGIGNVGQFYLFEFPLIVFGIAMAFIQKMPFRSLFVLWAIITILVASLTRDVPHATRSFFLLTPVIIFSSLGLIGFWDLLIKRSPWQRVALGIFLAGFIFYNLLFYFSSYYLRFPILYAKAWRTEDKTLSLFIKENEKKYNKIVFDQDAGFIYTSLLFYTAYSPSIFQKTAIWGNDDSEGFSQVLSFGKYEFRTIDWTKDYTQQNTLLITTDKKLPQNTVALKTFRYPKRPVVISAGQDVIQYPVEEVAYVVVESKAK